MPVASARQLSLAGVLLVAAGALGASWWDTRGYHLAIDRFDEVRPLMELTAANAAADAQLLAPCSALKYAPGAGAENQWRDCMAQAMPQLRSADMALRASRQVAAWLRVNPQDAELRTALLAGLRGVLPDAQAQERIEAAAKLLLEARRSSAIARWSNDAVIQPQARAGRADLRRAIEDAR